MFILSKLSLDYNSRLKPLHQLPLMYWLELQDLMFLIKCIKDPSDNFDISSHITFINSSTRVSGLNHLQHDFCRSTNVCHLDFNRIVSLWYSLVSHTDLIHSISSTKQKILTIIWDYFLSNFGLETPAISTTFAPAPHAILSHIFI